MESLNKLQELGQNFTILYVEDDEKLSEQTGNFFKKFFKSVDLAKNGQEGLNLYKDNSYEIVITDIKMPIMNGMDMIQYIREINPNQLILVISAFDFSHLLEPHHLTHKIDKFLLKPVKTEILVDALLTLCQDYKLKHKANMDTKIEAELKYLKEKVDKMDEKLDKILILMQ